MPYSGASDPKLPDHVKELSIAKRRQWVSAFNETMADCEGDDCEGKAMRVANGVAKGQRDYYGADVAMPASMASRVPQEDANYTPFGGVANGGAESCLRCRWFEGSNCAVVESWPDPILPSGHSDRFEAIPTYEPEPLEVEVVGERAVAKVVRAAISKVRGIFGDKPAPRELVSGFRTFQDAEGAWWWIGVTSNNGKDSHETWFGREAIKRYVQARDTGLPAGDVWFWHTPFTSFATCEGCALAEEGDAAFLVEWGKIKPEWADAAPKLADARMAMSHQFVAIPNETDPNLFEDFVVLERGPLPREAASNPWTAFGVSQQEERNMPIEPAKRDLMDKLFGSGMVDAVESQLAATAGDMADAKIEKREEAEAEVVATDAEAPVAEASADEPESAPATESPGEAAIGEREVAAIRGLLGLDDLRDRLAEFVTDTRAKQDALLARIDQIEAGQRDLKRSADERVADEIRPRAASSAWAGAFEASTSKDTVVDGRRSENGLGVKSDPMDEEDRPLVKAIRNSVLGPLAGLSN